MKDDFNKWKGILCFHWSEDLIVSRCQYSLNWSTDPIQSLSESHWILSRNWQSDLNTLLQKFKEPRTVKTLLKKEEQSWRAHTCWFQNSLKATVIETLCYWHNDGHVDRWDRIEGSETALHILWPIDLRQGWQNS